MHSCFIMSKDYSRDLFKQVQELMVKCDNLSQDMKTQTDFIKNISHEAVNVSKETIVNIKNIIGILKKQGRNFYKEIFNIY